MTTQYPAPMEFALNPGPLRDRVLGAAAALGLRVEHQDARHFSVIAATPLDAFCFGAACWPETGTLTLNDEA